MAKGRANTGRTPPPACFACATPLDCPYPEERCPNLHPGTLTEEHRAARNQAILAANAQGLAPSAIAEKFGMSDKQVRRILRR